MDLSSFYSLDAEYVKPYGIPHILYLIFCFTVIFLFVKKRAFIKAHANKVASVIFGIVLFQQVFLLYGWYVVVADFDLAESLPLHICRVSSLLSLIFIINRNQKYLDVIFYFSVYALSSFFYPLHVYHLAHISGISYMINHLMTVLMPIFGAIAFGWKPTWQGLKRGLLAFAVFFTVVFFINPILGSNYFYLVERPFLNNLSYEMFGLVAIGITVSGYTLITFLFYVGYSKFSKNSSLLNRQSSKLPIH